MNQSKSLQLAFWAAVCLAVQLPTADAAIIISKDVFPADVNHWDISTPGYVGSTADGELEVNGGSDLGSRDCYIGDEDTATGAVTVTGAGSTWTNTYDLYIGREGSGRLNIAGGAEVSSARSTYVAFGTGSTGSIHFGTGGGTLTTESLFASPTQLTGTGTINTRGLVSDVDLVFNSTASLTRTLLLDSQPGQNVTVNLDMGSDPSSNGNLGAGWKGHGSLAIRDGVTVNSYRGYIGGSFGSTGVVTVDGTGSTWANSRELHVGEYGSGTLNITDGAAVSNKYGYIGVSSGSTGVVTVDGAGSTWTNSENLYIGEYGSGTLDITGGATVVCKYTGSIGRSSGSTGVVTVDGAGSTSTNNWSLSFLSVGGSGSGTLNITGGAAVSTTDCCIGVAPGSTGVVTVDGAGSNWTNSEDLHIGGDGSGTLNIIGGAEVSNDYGSIGYGFGSTGVVTVVGAGSTWTNRKSLYVGRYGNGTLNISGDAAVSTVDNTYGNTYVADQTGSTGLIHFGMGGGTLTTRSLFASPTQLTGAGTINTRGLVGDVDLVFDSTASLTQTLVFDGQPGQNVTVQFDMAGNPSTNGDLGAGWQGHGSLAIRDGVTVKSDFGHVGYQPGSTGVVTVDGAGSTWINNGWLQVGNYGSGTLDISDGAVVSNSYSHMAYKSGSTGVVTVDGAGSTWTNSKDLYVGYSGSGTLNITGGGAVNNSSVQIGFIAGSTGVVTVDGPGSTWTNSGLRVGYSGSGTLNIIGGGTAVSNYAVDIGYSSNGVGVVTVDGPGSTWTNSSSLSIGDSGRGTLNITGGAAVSNSNGYISEGYCSPHINVVMVDGAGSTWTNSKDLYVGYTGRGTLNITAGAAVSNNTGHIGEGLNSTGVVTVDGSGSTWTNNKDLYLGNASSSQVNESRGTLHISGGGGVSAASVSINNESLLAIDVGNGSLLQIDGGSGTITNDGNVRILAGAGATAGNVYEPIAATDWGGSGGYQAVGGTWDETNHQFSVSDVVPGTSGSMVTIDCSLTQRVLIDDVESGWSVGASFLAADAASDVHVTATAVSGPTLAELESLLEAGDAVRGAWTFELTGGYTEGEPAYLSFDVGPGFDRSQVNLWHYDGSQWTEYAATDLTCNGDYASFTVTGFSGYAVSAVPEPGSLALLAAAALALLAQARWKPRGVQKVSGSELE